MSIRISPSRKIEIGFYKRRVKGLTTSPIYEKEKNIMKAKENSKLCGNLKSKHLHSVRTKLPWV